jgi:phage portal protein BeeE
MTGFLRSIGRLIVRQAASSGLWSPSQWFVDWATGNQSGQPGPVVNEVTALNYSVFYSCVALIAGTIATLPLKVYKRRADGGQDEAPDRD